MIEIVYEKEKQKPERNEAFFRIPNNIRQIGDIKGTQKIYIEDYAYTYLSRRATDNSHKGTSAILLGHSNWRDGTSYLFIKSAVALKDMEVSEDHLVFTQEIWNHVYEKNKEYFPDQEVVGWFLSIPGCSMELHEVICKTHLNHFGGNDKALFVMEPLEKEEAFYRYEGGKMERQSGFYVYYEKNEPMRSFLIAQNEHKEQKSETVDDSAVHTFRKKVEKKAAQETSIRKNKFPVFKAASACAVVAVLAVGVLYLNDYQKLKNAEQVLSEIDKDREIQVQGITPVNGEPAENHKNTGEDSKKGLDAEVETPQNQDSQIKNSVTNNFGLEGKNTSGNTENETEEEGEKEKEVQTESYDTYTVRQGDTITRISLRNYGTTEKIAEICSLNHISETDFIYPGQKILLP